MLVGPNLRREFFPEVDAGTLEVYLRAPTGTQLELTEERVAVAEEVVKKQIGNDLDLVVSEIGVTPDWSAAYTQNSGPMDAILKVQLKADRQRTAQQHVAALRQ